jgi:hypothetical protein
VVQRVGNLQNTLIEGGLQEKLGKYFFNPPSWIKVLMIKA